jgi:hypothetical protein
LTNSWAFQDLLEEGALKIPKNHQEPPWPFLAICLCFFDPIPVIKNMILVVFDAGVEQSQQFFIK